MPDSRPPASHPTPGEVRPATARRLERPPAERYGPARARSAARPRRGLALGTAAALVGAALWWLTGGLFDLSGGLVAVGVGVGWLVGTGVAYGTWGEAPHAPTRWLRTLAVGLGLAAWLVGSLLVYVFELAVLPDSTLPLAGRIASTPFVQFTVQQFLPLGPLELGAIAIFAWRASR